MMNPDLTLFDVAAPTAPATDDHTWTCWLCENTADVIAWYRNCPPGLAGGPCDIHQTGVGKPLCVTHAAKVREIDPYLERLESCPR